MIGEAREPRSPRTTANGRARRNPARMHVWLPRLRLPPFPAVRGSANGAPRSAHLFNPPLVEPPRRETCRLRPSIARDRGHWLEYSVPPAGTLTNISQVERQILGDPELADLFVASAARAFAPAAAIDPYALGRRNCCGRLRSKSAATPSRCRERRSSPVAWSHIRERLELALSGWSVAEYARPSSP